MLNENSLFAKHLLLKPEIETVASLAIPRTAVGTNYTVEMLGKIFLTDHLIQSVPVIQRKVPVGIVHRYQFMDIFLSPYGRDLYGKKTITHFMDTTPLLVEQDLSLQVASQYITRHMPLPVIRDFIITQHGQYLGVGTVMDLLKKVTELQIHEYNQVLEQKVRELEQRTAELVIANMKAETATSQAKAANQAKSRFLANMSHELRTPINAIIGYSEMLQEDVQELEYQSDLEKISQAGRHLLKVISDILDISKIESGKMELYLENFHFDVLVQEVATVVQPLMADKNNILKIENRFTGSIYTDMIKIRQCLLNLLSNAAKFSEKGTILLFSLREVKGDHEWLIFGVKDNGIGMTQEQITKLFQPFTQADNSTTRQYGGTGLGLAITKEFCEMMGGEIHVTSELGKGSTFVIHLPILSESSTVSHL